MKQFTVIGIGRMNRGDDALGLLALQQLQILHPSLNAYFCNGGVTDLFEHMRNLDRLLVLMALEADQAVGTLVEYDPRSRLLPQHWSESPRTFGLSAALSLSAGLGEGPAQVRILGLVAGSFEEAAGLTPAVACALPELLRRASDLLSACLH